MFHNNRVALTLMIRLFADQMQHDLAPMCAATMLEKINTLPGAKHEPSRGERNGKLSLGERSPDMCRHVVRPFRVVAITPVFGRDRRKESLQIGLHIGIRILLDEERSRGVAAEKGEEAGRDT